METQESILASRTSKTTGLLCTFVAEHPESLFDPKHLPKSIYFNIVNCPISVGIDENRFDPEHIRESPLVKFQQKMCST